MVRPERERGAAPTAGLGMRVEEEPLMGTETYGAVAGAPPPAGKHCCTSIALLDRCCHPCITRLVL